MEKPVRIWYNLKIIHKLEDLIIKNPDLRFGQLLVICDIIRYERDCLVDGQREDILTIDPFNEESKDIWERMINNKFIFKELYN